MLRDYQLALRDGIYASWQAGNKNVLAVLPTGGGKTVVFSHILAAERGKCIAIAHRQELVSQIALALARNGVPHHVIGGKNIIGVCSQVQAAELGRTYINPHARVVVAGVDTLIRRDEPWFKDVTLWVIDECQHLTQRTKWGKAVEMFPNARGLGVTATPIRTDGHGLGAHADGVMHDMVIGPNMRDLINRGYLTDYRIIAPPATTLHLESVPISASGDYSPPKLAEAVHKSSITGDAVAHYRRFANGKLGVTFCVDVEAARETVEAYRAADIPAEMITAQTPDLLRMHVLRRFRNREVLQLVNVDLFGEGFDLPAIEVVTMLRPTASYGLFVQQFGRALRLMDGKEHAIIIDHVGNVLRHGLPDRPRVWTLDRQERRAKAPSEVQVRVCPSCLAVFERIKSQCPYCSHAPEPASRGSVEFVDGDLSELSPDVLARMRGEIERIDGEPVYPHNATPIIMRSIDKRHRERQEVQAALRDAMAQWGGIQLATGLTLAEAQRKFYLDFGIDVASAQALGRPEAEALLARVRI